MANVNNSNLIIVISSSNSTGAYASIRPMDANAVAKSGTVKPREGRDTGTLGCTAEAFLEISKKLTSDDVALIYVPDNQVRRINEARKHCKELNEALKFVDLADEAQMAQIVEYTRNSMVKPWMPADVQESAIDLVEAWQNIFDVSADVNVRGYMESYGYTMRELGDLSELDIDKLISKDSKKLFIADSGVCGGFYTGIELDLIDGVCQKSEAVVNSNFLNGKRPLCVRVTGTGNMRKAEYFIPMENFTNGAGNRTANGTLADNLWGFNDGDVHYAGLIDVAKKALPRIQDARARMRAQAQASK